jgi:hypothetical protein
MTLVNGTSRPSHEYSSRYAGAFGAVRRVGDFAAVEADVSENQPLGQIGGLMLLPGQDVERLTRWITASLVLEPIEQMMMIPAQDLGRLDVQLIAMDAATHADPSKEVYYNERFGLSRFWVLGAYELVRTLDQRFRFSEDANASVNRDRSLALKREFERLRMPLAKFEPADKFPDDSPIAYPAINSQTGAMAWQVAAGVFIERRVLADRLLDFLEGIGGSSQSASVST